MSSFKILLFMFILLSIVLQTLGSDVTAKIDAIPGMVKSLQDRFAGILESVKSVSKFDAIPSGFAAKLASADYISRVTSQAGGSSDFNQLKSEKKGGLNGILSKYSVDKTLQSEIVSMSQALTPKETIIDHVRTHYPSISPAEASDIVVASIAVAGKPQPNNKQFLNMLKLKGINDLRNFNKQVDALIAS